MLRMQCEKILSGYHNNTYTVRIIMKNYNRRYTQLQLWRRSGSAVECRTLDRENTVTNPLHIGAVDGDSLWRCYATTKQNHCTCTLQ